MTQGKNDKKKKWQNALIWLGLIMVFLVVLKATWGLYQKSRLASDNLQSSIEQMAKLTERQVVLQNKIERLKTARGVEEEIRANFPVAKIGEQVINIVTEEPKATTTTATATSRWWQIF